MTKKQIWIIAGIVGAAMAVFCCAAAILGVLWLNRDDPEDVVEAYLSAVQDGKSAEARDHLCDSWRGSVLGNVANAMSLADVIDYEVTDSDTHDESATVNARVTFRVLGVTDSGELRFTLVREGDDWKVCGIRSEG